MSTPGKMQEDDLSINDQINQLAEENRTTCLWFLRQDYLPASTSERLTVLKHLETYGNRQTFVCARTLRDCLLQTTNDH